MSEPQNIEQYYKKKPGYQNLIRIARTNIDGNMRVAHGLSEVRGIGRRLALAILAVTGIDSHLRVGQLTEDQIEKLTEIMQDPVSHGIPFWMVNRQHDLRTGKFRHVSGTELELTVKRDIDRMRAMKSWKGVRHSLGLKVRGQRTRTTGRRGLVVGYQRKKARLAAKKKKGGGGAK